MSNSGDGLNIAQILRDVAKKKPYGKAVVETCGRDWWGRNAYAHLTFKGLDQLSDRMAHGFERFGITKGTRTVLMVTPGLDFAALTFGLFKVGAVIVMVDPGMGIKNLGKCLAEAEPEAFVGIPKAHVARLLLRWSPRTIKKVVTVGTRWFWGGVTLEQIANSKKEPYDTKLLDADEMAAILFTSGSTGVAKGAVYTHRIFTSQVAFLKETFDFGENDVDLATFPLFALFDPVLGVTAVIPDMDASKPAKAEPAKLVAAIEDQGCTQMFGSPALIDNLSRYGEGEDIQLPTLRRVISAGAPARPDVLERLQKMLPAEGQIHTPYGATESLPVASIGSREILQDTWKVTVTGGGTCVGKPVEEVEVAIITITDEPIEKWSDDLLVNEGEIGEIVVKGDVVTRSYFNRPEKTKLAKIKDDDGSIRHRMGDVGRFDERGRLWFCGRKAHRVETEGGPLFTVPCEAVFNVHPKVFRTALVGFGEEGKRRPVICVEVERLHRACDEEALRQELLEIAKQHDHTKFIDTFLFHQSFPVDVRHNAKINREELTTWAEGQLS